MNSLHIYKFIQLDNGDILLQKNIIDTTKYNIINNDNGDIILKQPSYINIIQSQIKNYNFSKSLIIQCLINDKNLPKLKYKSILCYIYDIIDDGSLIIKNTLLNIKTLKKEDMGYYYLSNIGISVQGVDSNLCLLEIMNQCTKNKINILIKIQLQDGVKININ